MPRKEGAPIGDYDDLGEYEVDELDGWDQCSECGNWTDSGSFSELDDEFLCDECAIGYTERYDGTVGDCE